MGKKGDKTKEEAKKAAKAEKQAKKTAKSTKKQAKKDGEEVEENIEALIAQVVAQDAKKTAVTLTEVERPSPRSNFSINPLPSGELVLFGGELNDGANNVVYNELYRCTGFGTPAVKWTLVSSPNTPPPRCSHQSVLCNVGPSQFLYVYGGEFATNLQFYHYSDTWKLELATSKWTRVDSKKAPSPRSGHRMIAWRNLLILFGGFHQSYSQDTWFRDLWVFDLRTQEWKEVVFPHHAQQPSARSGMQFALVPGKDIAVMYGGYSEVKLGGSEVPSVLAAGAGGGAGGKGGKGGKGAAGGAAAGVVTASAAAAMFARKSKSMVHTDLWVLKLGPMVSGASAGAGGKESSGLGVPVWERVRTVGMAPNPPRLGFSLSMYKDRAIIFGGVSDKEEGAGGAAAAAGGVAGDDIESDFHNELFSLDVGSHRWYQLALKAGKKDKEGGAGRRKKKDKKAGGAAGAGEEDDDDLLLTDEEGDDDEEDEDWKEARRKGGKKKKGSKVGAASGSGSGGYDEEDELDDNAFYYYENGKLVKMEAEPDAEDAEAKEGEAAESVSAPEPASATSASAAGASPSRKAAIDSEAPEPSKTPVVAPEEKDLAAAAPAPAAGAGAVAPAAVIAASTAPLPPMPCGRYKAASWIDGHYLYVFGGLVETKARETTLDDAWRIDLREREKWECLQEAKPHEWHGSDDEEEEDEDDEDDDDSEGDDDDDDEESDSESDGEEGAEDVEGAEAGAAGGAGGRGIGRMARGNRGASKEEERIRRLREKLGLEDPTFTPLPGEKLTDFFGRTGDSWVSRYVALHLTEGERIEGKALRRKAFDLAKARYDELFDVLEELRELEEMQRQLEAARNQKMEKKAKRGAGVGAAGGGKSKGGKK